MNAFLAFSLSDHEIHYLLTIFLQLYESLLTFIHPLSTRSVLMAPKGLPVLYLSIYNFDKNILLSDKLFSQSSDNCFIVFLHEKWKKRIKWERVHLNIAFLINLDSAARTCHLARWYHMHVSLMTKRLPIRAGTSVFYKLQSDSLHAPQVQTTKEAPPLKASFTKIHNEEFLSYKKVFAAFRHCYLPHHLLINISSNTM